MKRLLIFLTIFAFLGVACSTESNTESKKAAQSIEELQTQLESVLEAMHVPGMSIAIVHREGPEWIAGLGKADLADDKPATAATLFRIGSVSKGFISLAVLKLADEGKLLLEDPVQKLAPEVWFGNSWEASEPVRVVHLLENTTGWDDMHLCEFAKDPLTMSYVESLGIEQSSRISRWPPGTRMAYCNSGPAVAAYIVEKITGLSFEEYVGQNFFKPIGMHGATYFQPDSTFATTLYQGDGKTPLPYWNLLYPSIGSINASASDMANYLLFYLNWGKVQGIEVVPAPLFDRMEVPSSTWAAKDGLRVGYGLNNYSSLYDGFVYHGHDGHVPGGHTAMQYLSKEGVGYFYSVNSGNLEAFKEVGEIIRAYITRNLQKPSIPPVIPLPEEVKAYTGWYEPNSPRMEVAFFLERLIGMAHLHFEDNKLLLSSLEKKGVFIPVTDTEFLYAPKLEFQDTVPTLKLLTNPQGQFIQLSLGLRSPSIHITMKRIPAWLAIFEIATVGFALLSFISIFGFAPFWILSKKHRSYAERRLLFWPLIAGLSLLSIGVICMLTTIDLAIPRLGNLTIWSFSLCVATIAFAAASVASIVALWRAPKVEVHGMIRIYTQMVTLALAITTAYLAYWGIIGLRTWI